MLAERLRHAAASARQSPLSFAQQRLWFLDQLEPNSPLYNIATVAQITGALDVPAFEHAFNVLIARHEALRTRFICPDETPFQVVDEHVHFKIRRVDLAASPAEEREAEARRIEREE